MGQGHWMYEKYLFSVIVWSIPDSLKPFLVGVSIQNLERNLKYQKLSHVYENSKDNITVIKNMLKSPPRIFHSQISKPF